MQSYVVGEEADEERREEEKTKNGFRSVNMEGGVRAPVRNYANNI